MKRLHLLTTKKSRIDEINNFIEEWNKPSDFFTVHTSGSTGKPKFLKLSKQFALASAEITGNYFSYKANDRLALCLSLSGIGAKMQLIRAAYFGMDLVVCDTESNPLQQLDLPIKQISLVPLQLKEMLAQSKTKLHLFESILLGGAALDESLRQEILDNNLPVFESYGMSETYSHVALRKVEEKNAHFEALPGIRFSSVDDKLSIHASHLGINSLETNDLVNLLSETSFEWLGRADFAINSGGYKFIPEILEQKLAASIKEDFFIIGEKDVRFGEIVTLFVEAHYSTELKNNIENVCRKILDRYQLPKKFYFVPNFMRTGTGKTNRLETQKLVFES